MFSKLRAGEQLNVDGQLWEITRVRSNQAETKFTITFEVPNVPDEPELEAAIPIEAIQGRGRAPREDEHDQSPFFRTEIPK